MHYCNPPLSSICLNPLFCHSYIYFVPASRSVSPVEDGVVLPLLMRIKCTEEWPSTPALLLDGCAVIVDVLIMVLRAIGLLLCRVLVVGVVNHPKKSRMRSWSVLVHCLPLHMELFDSLLSFYRTTYTTYSLHLFYLVALTRRDLRPPSHHHVVLAD
jgi:hypothetical protein